MKKNELLLDLAHRFRPTRADLWSYLVMMVGSAVSAASLVLFIKPAGIPLGGVNGVCLVLNFLFNLPVGTMSFLFNLPLFYINYKFLGGGMLQRTVFCTFVNSMAIDLLTPFLPVFEGDILLAVLYGAVGMAVGNALVLMQGGTQGGTDIICKVLNVKKGASIGTMNLTISAVIITLSAVIYGRLESAMYAIVLQFVYGKVLDGILYGLDESTGVFIITDKPREVADAVMVKLHRGVTALSGVGMYTMSERSVLMSAVRRNESMTVKKIVSEVDPGAFVIFSEVKEVYGQGFKHYTS